MEEQKRNPAQGLSESEQVQVRRQKLADLQAAGHDPFTLTKYPQDAYSADLKEEFKDLPNETDSGKQVALAGRMMSKRVMGKASFAHLRDDKGDIQLYVRRDELGDEPYAAFKKLDVGDIIGVKGEVFRTKTGELSVRATELVLLAKSLRPLPEKFHGLTDTEMRYRQRYVDLIANPEVKDTFVKRSQILKEIRAYLDEKGFLEVDTPILTPFEIGASARPFYTHHNSLNMDMVLRIETELYLKRLIVGGMDRVYEVGRIFRNEGMDPKHNPEFTSIELYQAFTDFHGMMDLVEELYKRLAVKICGSMVIPYQGKQIDMGHWERLTMIEAVKKYSGVDFNDWADRRGRHCRRQGAQRGAARGAHQGCHSGRVLRCLRGGQAHPAHLHLRLSRGDQPAGQAQAGRPRLHRALRVFHRLHRVRQRLQRAERPHRPEGPLRASGGRAQGHRARLQGPGGLRLRQRSGVRPAPHGRPGLRRGPSGHAAYR